MIKIEKIAYAGWPNCYRLSNPQAEIVVTTDVGPRLLRFALSGGQNVFKEFSQTAGKSGGDTWNSFGGHRLWHAPEDAVRTYQPDNEPVELQQHDNFVRLIQPVEAATGLQKEIDVYLDDQQARVRVVHRFINRNLWDVEFAPWMLSVMAPGGVCVFPLPERGTHPKFLAPASSLTLWRFTDLSDPRWTWGRKYILLRADESASTPQKVGASVPDGWAAYANDNTLFVKTFAFDSTARYADLGANFETFTNADILEVETLAPLAVLRAGQSNESTEEWALFPNVPTPQSEADVEAHILPLVNSLRG